MKRLRLAATITAILGLLSVGSIVFLFFALSDIADNPANSQTEWYIAGVCLLIISVFTISVFITLGYLLKTSDRLINLTTDTGINK
ncbi:MAG TPA: hypothetical protein VK213_07735 [Bacteroidales bacterium]|nr:hypothetical protein [Bacteroidales bacterium]